MSISKLIFCALVLAAAGCSEETLPVVEMSSEKAIQNSASLPAPVEVPESSRRNFDEFAGDIREILPEFASFGKYQGREVELLDSDSMVIAFLRLAPEKYERVEGFEGFVNVAVVVKNNRICGIAIGKNSETPRWLQRVKRSPMLKAWNGKTLPEAAELEVDAVTSATYTSNAVKAEVRAIVK